MWPFDGWRRKRILDESLIGDALWRRTLADHPILGRLRPGERARLRELTTLFLHEKLFEPVRGLTLDDSMRAMIAVQACLPILNLGLDWYDDWRTVVVYPAQFVRPRAQFDGTGVMHEWQEMLGGEAWERGPVILSWADVEASGVGEGYNVVLHEMAHKLDMRNGDADGFPPLHRGMQTRAWTDAFAPAYEDLNRRAETGHDTPVDPYAAESPAEFFAVVSEYFFERPGVLMEAYPAVYRQLAEFYRQQPLG
ncbi:MAG: zinc-dependent peptidase [Methylococcaceae bacterium]|nr:zinc-dependent peptidase [Methylococcaceae bacterium]